MSPPEVATAALRARRREVARAAGRRRLRLLLSTAGVVAAFVGGLALLHSPLFAAGSIDVVGARQTGRQAVLDATGLWRHPPLIDLSTATDERALERLPWVLRATVTREWPSSVRVVVTERLPVAEVALAGRSRYALVDETGRVLEDTATRVTGLALVLGAGPVPPPGGWLEPPARAAAAVAGAIPVSLVNAVASVESAWPGGVRLRLRSGTEVLLGPATQLREKMVSLATVLRRVGAAPAAPTIVTIDLRVPSDPVLTS